MAAPVEIDGSLGEGGGQVVRTSLTLSVLTGRPVRIRNIRARRRRPGLAPQHLTNVRALATISEGEVRGAEIGSTEVVFEPGSKLRVGEYLFDVAQATPAGSAGSVTLILQTLLLPLAFATADSRVTLRGGTHVAWSPPFHYLTQVFLPVMADIGVRAECWLEQWGFYPVGGGSMRAEVRSLAAAEATSRGSSKEPAGNDEATAPKRLASMTRMERGPLRSVCGLAVAGSLPSHIAQRIANRSQNVLREAGLISQVTPRRVRSSGPGAGVFLVAEYEGAVAGFSALGAKGKPSETVAEEACRELLAHHRSGAPVDAHLADQLLLPLALADGVSRLRVAQLTSHLRTNADVIGRFLPARIELEGEEGAPATVVIEGIGLPVEYPVRPD